MVAMVACTSEIIPEPAVCDGSLLIGTTQVQGTDCGESDGLVSLIVRGGEGPYTFSLENTTNTDGTFTGLPAGNYTASVTDGGGCTASVEFRIENTDGLTVSTEVQPTACDESTGSIRVTPSGGEPPYRYSIDDEGFQRDSLFEELSAGSYELKAIDANGCEVTESIELPIEDLFEDIKQIMLSDCARSGCHDGSRSPNLLTENSIKNNADDIRSEVVSGDMPPSRPLPDDEVALIVCWVEGL